MTDSDEIGRLSMRVSRPVDHLYTPLCDVRNGNHQTV